MKKIPKFKALRIFIVSALFYFFLVMPFLGFIFIQKIPDLINSGIINNPVGSIGRFDISVDTTSRNNSIDLEPISKHGSSFNSLLDSLAREKSMEAINDSTLKLNDLSNAEEKSAYVSISFDIFYVGMGIALVILLLISYPFKRYFRKKRKGQEVSTRLEFFCRRYLLYTPAIYTALFSIVVLSTVGYIAYLNYFVDLTGNINESIIDEYFYIAALAGFLSILFVFYWHKHRVHIFYLEVLFQEEELRKRIFRNNLGRIRNRLWLASGMTTFLPLGIVVFYLVLSVTRVSDLGLDTTDTLVKDVLLGKYASIFSGEENLNDLYYVNSVNTYMMFFGIGTSIFVSLIYILSFVRWSTLDIVFPVKELLGNMQKTGEGRNTNFSFVPKQFLDFLNKENITDIHLGDQIQKEMTVMFSDIRSFTEISEELDPRDNFNFINHYLGYMEPVISQNGGFIDKYIGDAIMALFPDSVDEAIDAAIEMRVKLSEFNEDLELNDKNPIDIGIGLNTGLLMLGIVGGQGRLEGTVISDHVNLASRLEGLTKKYGSSIIISQDTLIKLRHPENYLFRFLDVVKVKGKRNSVNIFEIYDGDEESLRLAKKESIQDFNKALQWYRDKNFEDSLKLFQDIAEKSPDDKACTLYIKRIEKYLRHGTPNDWDGVADWQEK
ncbi:MAG: hypothetical protein B7C24_15975 [Bacteroidetes bacterium 4572_77]|nr:MAG: hypothetical protein B7C24_15975 [Bacteroidetes bacterium 4572_77]